MLIIQVIWKYLVSEKSAAEHGTVYQIRNLIGRSNVVKKPKKDVNACEDFLQLVLYSYITEAVMEVLEMKSTDEWPDSIAEDMWLCSKEERQKKMDEILSIVVDKYVSIEYNTHCSTTTDDKVLQYSKQLLSLGCIYLEFTDAIREGDGKRILRCWKYLAIIFHNSNRTNYAKEGILLLHQYYYVLSPREMEQLLYNRFINTSGVAGRNISADLHMEHLNKEVKIGIAGLRSGKTEDAIVRFSKAIGTVTPILEQFDEVNRIAEHHTRHKAPNMNKDLLQIVNHINKCKIFSHIPGRKYPSFPNPRCLLHKQKENELISWMKTHI